MHVSITLPRFLLRFYCDKDHPAAEIAVLEVMNHPLGTYTRGVRLPHSMEIQETIVDSLEKAFSGTMSAEEALNRAVQEGNKILSSRNQ